MNKLTYEHPIAKQAEQAWAEYLESNPKLQELDDVALSFYADGFIDGFARANLGVQS